MKFGLFLAALVLPTVTAFAQQPQPQKTLQSAIDEGTAGVTRTLVQWGGQIIADQQEIAQLQQENAALKKRVAEIDKKPDAPQGQPQLGTGK
jgi:cell division protein FtsB